MAHAEPSMLDQKSSMDSVTDDFDEIEQNSRLISRGNSERLSQKYESSNPEPLKLNRDSDKIVKPIEPTLAITVQELNKKDRPSSKPRTPSRNASQNVNKSANSSMRQKQAALLKMITLENIELNEKEVILAPQKNLSKNDAFTKRLKQYAKLSSPRNIPNSHRQHKN